MHFKYEKIFLAKNKVKVFGHLWPSLIMAYGRWFTSNFNSKWGTPF